jgi:hypothetical protein
LEQKRNDAPPPLLLGGLRIATWTFFGFSVSFSGAAAILFVLQIYDVAAEVFSWAQQCAILCGACFGMMTLWDIDRRVTALEERRDKR